MTSKLILSDADDVLLSWYQSFVRWAHREKGLKPATLEHFHDSRTYFLSDIFKITPNEAEKFVIEFNQCQELETLPAFRDACYGVNKLKQHGYKLGVVSSLGESSKNYELRVRNLHSLFGEDTFEFIKCLPMNSTKEDYLRKFEGSNLWWIEDKWENAELGHNLGLRSIVMNQGHNYDLSHKHIKRVDTWLQICDHILDECDCVSCKEIERPLPFDASRFLEK